VSHQSGVSCQGSRFVEGERREFNLHANSPSASRGHCRLFPGGAFGTACSGLPLLLLLAKVQLFCLPTPSHQPSVLQLLHSAVLPSGFTSGEEGECWGSLLWTQMQGKKAQWLKWEGVLLAPKGRSAQGDVGKSGLRQ